MWDVRNASQACPSDGWTSGKWVMSVRNAESSLQRNRPLGQRYSLRLNFSACELYSIAGNPGPQPLWPVGAHPPVLHPCNSSPWKPHWTARKVVGGKHTAYPKCSLGLLRHIPRWKNNVSKLPHTRYHGGGKKKLIILVMLTTGLTNEREEKQSTKVSTW